MIKKWLQVLVIAAVISVMPIAQPAAEASAVTDGLKSVVDQVLTVVADPNFNDKKKERRAKIRGIINPKFNYQEMGKRSLAKNWKKLSSSERKEFVALFAKLLENSYASKIESYKDEKINYVDEVLKGKYAMVKTEVVRKNDSIGVDYKLLKRGDNWQVYDFIIEGVSMVRNYRSQFSKIIHKESFNKLMEQMDEKVRSLEENVDKE
jgi:phospholipid transport system substrate-binding protein